MAIKRGIFLLETGVFATVKGLCLVMYLLIVSTIPSFSLVYSVNEVGVSFGEVTSEQKEEGIL